MTPQELAELVEMRAERLRFADAEIRRLNDELAAAIDYRNAAADLLEEARTWV